MEDKIQEEASIINVSNLTCIDLANSNLHQSAVLLKQACLDSGFFYVINHGISEELKDQAFEQSKKFFDLPLEEKMKVFRNENFRGYAPLHDQLLDPINQVRGDDKEGFTIGNEGLNDGPYQDKSFYSPNIWPSPDVLPGWRETMEKYYQEALRVCKSIARIMALALDLDADYFDKPEMLGNPIADMLLFHYEGVSNPSKGIYGCGAHCDFGMLSLLATDGVMGLQICKDKDSKPEKWEYVPSIKGAYIVNLGNLLERWSNGFFKSTLHRVLGNGQDRYSIPFFVKPSHDCIIECLPTCQSENNQPKSIARIMALALDLDVGYFDTPEILGNPIADMILFHYEGISDPSKGMYACGAHCDFGMMSLLATDGVINGTSEGYIVNLGDLLERWSNGFFKSTLHRVLGTAQDRYSIPFFVKPSHDCIIECLSTCQSQNNLPIYPPIKLMFNVPRSPLQSRSCTPQTDLSEVHGPRRSTTPFNTHYIHS